MQFVGDAVMAVFGAPVPQADHADRAVVAALAMHALQTEINGRWRAGGLPAFGLGLGLSTGEAAAALLGSEERLEYTLVGDTVNLSQRLQQLADRRRDGDVRGDVQGAAHPRSRPSPSPRSWSRDVTPRSSRTRSIGPDDVGVEQRRGDDRHQGDGTPSETSSGTRVRGVRKTFEAENAPVRALRGVNLDRRGGRVHRPDGSVGLRQVDAAEPGRRARRGRRRGDLRRRRAGDRRTEDEHARMRRRDIGIVFQFFNLLEGMTRARERGPAGDHRRAASARRPRSRARDLLDLLGIGDKARGARRALGRPAPAARDRAGAGERAHAAAGRRADRSARLRRRPRRSSSCCVDCTRGGQTIILGDPRRRTSPRPPHGGADAGRTDRR